MTHFLSPAFSLIDDENANENSAQVSARSFRLRSRREFAKIDRETSLSETIQSLPAAGESIHIVSAARFDFWTFVPQLLARMNTVADWYCSTWTTSRANVDDLFAVMDSGAITRAHVLTGTYFKRRETAVYAKLLDGLQKRPGCRFIAFANHAKVMLLSDGTHWLTVEGSANLTANPRLEQFVVINDRRLYEFHRDWMEEQFAAGRKKPETTATPRRDGFPVIRAGNCIAVTLDPRQLRVLRGWKFATTENPTITADIATQLAELIRRTQPVVAATHPAGPVLLSCPPQGATIGAPYRTASLVRQVATQLSAKFIPLVRRSGRIVLESTPRRKMPVIIVDDSALSGETMRTALAALESAGFAASGVVYVAQ